VMTKKTAECPVCKRQLSGIKTGPRVKSHLRREPKRLPPPYSEQELAHIQSWQEKRGTTVTRLACALAEESFLRVGEIINLALADVDLAGRRLFIRRNKTSTETWVPFHDKPDKYLRIWLAERDASVQHEYLLCRPNGRPHNGNTLHNAIAGVVCKTVGHRKVNEDGLDSWSANKLRCTMALRLVENGADAATVMAAGGWKTTESMAGYARVENYVADRGYQEAMARAAERKSRPQTS